MARYLIEAATRLQPLQAGDYPQPLAFIVPTVIDMADYTDAVFTMEDSTGLEVINKNVASGFVEVVGQVITILFEENDTKDIYGVFDWVLKITNANEKITIGYGAIQINRIVK
jgi:hypothetical protein